MQQVCNANRVVMTLFLCFFKLHLFFVLFNVIDFDFLILLRSGEDLNRHFSVSRQTLPTPCYLPDTL